MKSSICNLHLACSPIIGILIEVLPDSTWPDKENDSSDALCDQIVLSIKNLGASNDRRVRGKVIFRLTTATDKISGAAKNGAAEVVVAPRMVQEVGLVFDGGCRRRQ